MATNKQTEQNTADIAEIKSDIRNIKDNHLYHIERDMEKQSKMIEKMDARLWWVLGILVVGVVLSNLGGYLNGL